MQSQTARIASFSSPRAKTALRWPHPSSFFATPASLAAAGFYFSPSTETPDAVSCFLCNKGLADWEPDDDPALIHAQKCPTCPWAILRCVSDVDQHGSITFASLSRLPTSPVMERARLATFGPDAKRWWPHEAKNKGPDAKTMANSGFMYLPAGPKDDTCICIYCRTELGGWQPDDDPMEEHRKRQSKNGPCPFFTSTSPHTKQRPRSKSKPPPLTTPGVSKEDEDDGEYPPPPASTRTPAASSSTKRSTKSKSKKKPKTIEQEVVEEYHIALDEDEDALPKPRPKSRRTSSRSGLRSRTSSGSRASSRSRASSALSTLDSTSIDTALSSSTKKSKSQTPRRPASPASSTSSHSKSKKRTESDSEDMTQRSTRSRSRLPPSEDNDVRRSKSGGKGKKSRADVDSLGDDEKMSAPKRKSKGKGKSKAIQGEEEEELGPEPARGRGKNKVKSSKEEAEAEPLPHGRSNDKVKASAKQDAEPTHWKTKTSTNLVSEVRDEVETTRGRSRRIAPKDAKSIPISESSQAKRAAKDIIQRSTEDDLADISLPQHKRLNTSQPHRHIPVSAPAIAALRLNGTAYPHPGHVSLSMHSPYKSFESPEDEELAREELALEAQALELMLAASTPPLLENSSEKRDMDRDKAHLVDMDMGPPFPPPTTPPPLPTAPPPTTPLPPQPTTPLPFHPTTPPPLPPTTPPHHLPNVPKSLPRTLPPTPPIPLTLPPEERSMTVEQWIRHEMQRQYERLRSDGRAKIEAFKRRAEEVARRIEGM